MNSEKLALLESQHPQTRSPILLPFALFESAFLLRFCFCFCAMHSVAGRPGLVSIGAEFVNDMRH